MGFYEYFRNRVAAIQSFVDREKPEALSQKEWNDMLSTKYETLIGLQDLKEKCDSLSPEELHALEQDLSATTQILRYLQFEFQGSKVAERIVKEIKSSPENGKFLALGELTEVLTDYVQSEEVWTEMGAHAMR